MTKGKVLEKLMRVLITLLGVGVGAAVAALLIPLLRRFAQAFSENGLEIIALYAGLCLLGGLIFFLLSRSIINRTIQLLSAVERRWERMPMQQILFSTFGLLLGLAVAALLTQLVLYAGASLITLSFSALIYLLLGTIGLQIGYRRYRDGKKLFGGMRRRSAAQEDSLPEDEFIPEDIAEEGEASYALRKYLDTSVIIDGRIADIVKTGFLEGELVIAQFVLAELRHIADSGDDLRRARGRRGLDVLGKLQKEAKSRIVIDETDYEEVAEVDVKLLRLCREKKGVVVTNDYNLNKVAGVTGIHVLNINELANAVKPMLMAGEELTVQVMREGKEPGQGVAFLDDGTMIVVDGGRRHVGEHIAVMVTTVLQTSAGRMIFTKVKQEEERV